LSTVKTQNTGRIDKLTKDERGDISYVETFVTVFAVMILIAFAVNVFSFFTLKQDLEYLSEQIVIFAAGEGRTDVADGRIDALCAELGLDRDALTVSFEGSSMMSPSGVKVQYGEEIKVSVTYRTSLEATGILTVPVSMTASASGLSEKYWKP